MHPAVKSLAATAFYGWLFFGVRDPLFASVSGRPLFLGLAAVLSLALLCRPDPRLRAVAYAMCMAALTTRAVGFLAADRRWQDRVTGAVVYLYVALLTTELVLLRTRLWGPTGRPARDAPR